MLPPLRCCMSKEKLPLTFLEALTRERKEGAPVRCVLAERASEGVVGKNGAEGVRQDPARRGRTSRGSDPSRTARKGEEPGGGALGPTQLWGAGKPRRTVRALGGRVLVPPWPWGGGGEVVRGGDTGDRLEFVETANLKEQPSPGSRGQASQAGGLQRGGWAPRARVTLCHSCRDGTWPSSQA